MYITVNPPTGSLPSAPSSPFPLHPVLLYVLNPPSVILSALTAQPYFRPLTVSLVHLLSFRLLSRIRSIPSIFITAGASLHCILVGVSSVTWQMGQLPAMVRYMRIYGRRRL